MRVHDRKSPDSGLSSPARSARARGGRRSPWQEAIKTLPRATSIAKGGGERLDRATLSWSKKAFDHDFSGVRVHQGSAAAQAASQRGARAFAVGSDIYLGSAARGLTGQASRGLLAHELTHVVQQRHRRIDESRVEPVDSPAEREAHRVAASVMAGGRAPTVRHVPVGVPRDALWSSGGKFAMTQYDAFDGDPGKNTTKVCGVDIKITFTPAKSLLSDEISFVQIMKTEQGGKPLLFDNEKPRATTAKQGGAGWAVDMVEGNKYADYQIGNDGKAVPSWGQLGYRKSATDFLDSIMIDGVRLPRNTNQTFKVQATSFALDKTHGKYLGGVDWGYDVNAKGVIKKKKAEMKSSGAPEGVHKAALKQWNAQAKNPDVSKRNAPDQLPITEP